MKNTENRGFSFALPFDPFRLLLAVMEKFGLILLAAIVCGGLGIAYAVFKLGDTYQASIDLVSKGWHTKRADEGTTYVPMPITDEAVVIAGNADEVFEMAAKKIGPDIPGGAVRGMVGLEQKPGEGLFGVSANTSEGAQMTHKVVTAYADALMDYTAQLRKDEARREFEQLEKQLKEKEAATQDIQNEIVTYVKENGIYEALGSSGTEVTQIGQMKKSLYDNKADFGSFQDQTIALIRKEAIVPLKQELVSLLARYTEGSGQVRAKREQIRKLESQLAASTNGGDFDLDELEPLLPPKVSTAVRDLQTQRSLVENRIQDLTARLSASESDIGGLPEQQVALAQMRKILEKRIEATAVINGQMNDAQFFAKNAPSSLSIFHAPGADEVHHKSLIKKAITLGVMGLIGGAGAVVGLSLLLELLGRKVRTPMQAAIAAGAYPKMVFPPSRKTSNEIALRNFWVRGVSRFLPGDRRMLFPVIGDLPNEAGFWSGLFDSIEDQGQRVVFVDFSTEPLALGLPGYNASEVVPVSSIDPGQFTTADLKAMVENFPEGHVLVIRWDLNPNSTLVELAPHIDRHYIMTSQEVSLSTVEEESLSYRDIFGDADGLVLVNSRRPKRSQMIVNRLQDWYLESYRRRDLRSTNTPLAH